MRGCSFKGSVTLSELPKDDPFVWTGTAENSRNARVAGLFAASGGWLPANINDFGSITVQDFEVANNTVEGIISGPRSVARFFCFQYSGYTHVYSKVINELLATYVHDNTFVEGGDVRGILFTDPIPNPDTRRFGPIISLISYLEETLTYDPVN